MAENTFSGWAILEILGHRRIGGFVQEVQIAGAGLLRIDVPEIDGQPGFTQFYPPSALYCLTPTTEEIARAVAASNRPAPVQRWELPQLTAPKKPTTNCVRCGGTMQLYEDGAGDLWECPSCGATVREGE